MENTKHFSVFIRKILIKRGLNYKVRIQIYLNGSRAQKQLTFTLCSPNHSELIASMASFASTTADSVPTGNEIDYKKAHFDRLSEKIKEVGALGSALIVGIQTADCEEDDEDEEDEEDDTKMYTKEQIESLRHIIVNKKRDAAFKVANRMVTGGQGDFCMFNTQSGNDLILNIIRYTKSSKAKKTLPEQYDSLLALTMQIDQYDFWMNDNEFWEPGGKYSFHNQITLCHV